MYYVYVLKTSGNTFYVGQTNNLEKRLKQHSEGKRGAKYLRMFDGFELHYVESAEDKSAALKREYKLKTLSHDQKRNLRLFVDHIVGI